MNSGDFCFFALLLIIGALGLLVCAALWFCGTLDRLERERERAQLDSMPKDLTSCPNCYELHDRSSFFCSTNCEREFFQPRHEPREMFGQTVQSKNTLPHGGVIQRRASMPSPGASHPAANPPAAVGESFGSSL